MLIGWYLEVWHNGACCTPVKRTLMDAAMARGSLRSQQKVQNQGRK
jgi:hypothetical protein